MEEEKEILCLFYQGFTFTCRPRRNQEDREGIVFDKFQPVGRSSSSGILFPLTLQKSYFIRSTWPLYWPHFMFEMHMQQFPEQSIFEAYFKRHLKGN